MTDNTNVDAVTRHVRNLILRILQRVKFAGRDELIQQAEDVDVSGGPITLLDLRVNDRLPASTCANGPVPLSAMVTDLNGTNTGELLVWVKDGYLSGLEFAWWTDDPPQSLPSVDQVHVA